MVSLMRVLVDLPAAPASRDVASPLSRVIQAGSLRVALDNASVGYFIYRGRPMGIQLELLGRFATSLGLDLQVVPVQTPEQGFAAVRDGAVDVYAPSAPPEMELSHGVYASVPYAWGQEVPQGLRWHMGSGYPDLLVTANRWLEANCNAQGRRRVASQRAKLESRFRASTQHSISSFDSMVRRESQSFPYDWRLISAVMYQESRFRPDVVSPRGAYGVMQFMPSAARYFGIPTRATPRQQVRAGLEYFQWLDELFAREGVPPENRLQFVLAAYNAGFQRVRRARRQAQADGKSPNIWVDNVAHYCSTGRPAHGQGRRPEYGTGQTCNYVYEVLTRYGHYRNIVN